MEQFRDSHREKTDALLRDLGADDVVIEKVTLLIDDDRVQRVVRKLRAFAQENPAVVLGALSALVAGGAVAAGVAVKKSSNKSKRTASRAASEKAPKAASAKRKAASKRTVIEPHPGDKRYVRRDAKGRIKESVDVGRSLAADARQHSRKRAKPGSGDKGDR